jgi:hypothetical protein
VVSRGCKSNGPSRSSNNFFPTVSFAAASVFVTPFVEEYVFAGESSCATAGKAALKKINAAITPMQFRGAKSREISRAVLWQILELNAQRRAVPGFLLS